MHRIGVLLFVLLPLSGFSQLVAARPGVSLRGLSSPSATVVWTSGSGGTVGRSVDAGNHWTWISVPGYARRDFRDIYAYDSNTAVVIAVDTPAVILRTSDGGVNWLPVLFDDTPGMFLDAMDFMGAKGIVVGDPVGGRFYLAMTQDSGRTWLPFSDGIRPAADSGEGCFASSGTNIRLLLQDGLPYAFVSGGPVSRLFTGSAVVRLPVLQGAVSTGANSIGISGPHWIIVGGDFAHDSTRAGNCLISSDGGAHWRAPASGPFGYRSCVVHLSGPSWLCCGTSGVDFSGDNGEHWVSSLKQSYNVAVRSGRWVFMAGAHGRVFRFLLH